MAMYDVEIIRSPTSRKAIKLICTISGTSEREVGRQIQFVPFILKESVPLSEAVEIERQFKRLGVLTRLVKVEENADSSEAMEPDSEDKKEEEAKLLDQRVKKDDVIEIPDDQIKILRHFHEEEPSGTFKRKKVIAKRWWINWFSIPLIVIAIIAVSLYIIAQMSSRQDEMEISLCIAQWQNTLHQQDLLLDKGIPPDRIFYKLDELEGKIERLLLLIRSAEKAKGLRAEFEQVKEESQGMVIDLAFRKSLVDAGYPIHPVCLLDRGMVRGTSRLPESTLLRIQLLGEDHLESVYFAARISGGAFKLIIDPSIERKIYDARATVASFSQQPQVLQRWARRKFPMMDISKAYLPAGGRLTSLQGIFTPSTEGPKAPPSPESSDLIPLRNGVTLSDPGNDEARTREIKNNITAWTETILESQQHDFTTEDVTLTEIYQRLLDLEVRIDQLIGLLESTLERNIWIERREDVYGSFIDTRRQIEELYNEQSKSQSPIHLESSIRKSLREYGFKQAEVLVIDSNVQANSFIIEAEIFNGELGDALVALARTIVGETEGVDFQIDRIMLRYKGEMMWWTPDQVRKAFDTLSLPDGRKSCIRALELSALSTPVQ